MIKLIAGAMAIEPLTTIEVVEIKVIEDTKVAEIVARIIVKPIESIRSVRAQKPRKVRKTVQQGQALSKTELKVYSHIITGERAVEVAAKLKIAEKTVKFHKTNIYIKTGVRSIAQLIAKELSRA